MRLDKQVRLLVLGLKGHEYMFAVFRFALRTLEVLDSLDAQTDPEEALHEIRLAALDLPEHE